MDFVLFVILTGTLFLRPAEIVTAWAGLPIYNYTILMCLVAAAPRITQLFQRDQLRRQPILIGVIGMLIAVAVSHLIRLDLYHARTYTTDFSKVVVFFFLCVAVLNSRQRLQQYIYWVAFFTVVLTFLAVGHYLEYFEIEALEALKQRDYDAETGDQFTFDRLKATGIFNDPNDLSMILVTSMCICGMGILDRFSGPQRYLWLLPLGFLGYALTLTHSRGGFLAMAAAGISLIYSRFGLRSAVITVALCLPLVGVFFGGRQTDISGALSGGTGHARVELWSGGIQALKTSPLFGVGYRRYSRHAGQVAHNSYIHAIVELGILGGAVFIGCFWLAARVMWNLGRQRRWITAVTGSPRLASMQPFLIAIMVGYMVSMISLSRTYAIPTYLILGLIASYQNIAVAKGIPVRVKLDGREIMNIFAMTILYLVATYVYIRIGFR